MTFSFSDIDNVMSGHGWLPARGAPCTCPGIYSPGKIKIPSTQPSSHKNEIDGNERGLFPCLFRARQCACAFFIKSKLFTYHTKKIHLLFIFMNNILLNSNLLENKLNNDQFVHSPTLLFKIRLSQCLEQSAWFFFIGLAVTQWKSLFQSAPIQHARAYVCDSEQIGTNTVWWTDNKDVGIQGVGINVWRIGLSGIRKKE